MQRGRFQAGADEWRRGGEDDVRPLLHGLFHQLRRVLARLRGVGADGYHVAQLAFQVLAAHVVRGGPLAGLRAEGVDEGHVQVAGQRLDDAREQPAAGGLVRRLRRLGLHSDGLVALQQADVRPHGLDALHQVGHHHRLHVRHFVDAQPDQQRFRRRHGQFFAVELAEGLAKAHEAGGEALALGVRPGAAGLAAQRLEQLCVAARAAEIHAVEPREGEKVHEFVVNAHAHVVRIRGHQAHYARGDARRAVAAQHAHALVPLLHVELAHVLIAADGVVDALFAQVGRAEADPLGGEFRVRRQQRHVVGGEGQPPLGVLGADDELGGYLHHAQVHAPDERGLVEYLVQHPDIGVAAADHAGPAVFLPGPV